MSQSTPILTLSVAASGAVAAHRFVTPARDQAVADENTLGVARTAAADTEQVAVDVLGTTVVEAGAAIAAGATIKSDANGKAVTWATSGGKVAVALEAASADGDLIEVLLIPNAA
ncbi:MAG: DUF2190 family protein [Rhodocyclaceae bacterium]|nr:DUF2190 family protein [Gammaproteobacteria bacterium]MCB1886355.1 DUF2190 family protein [Rhodocyclaceae bacterium]